MTDAELRHAVAEEMTYAEINERLRESRESDRRPDSSNKLRAELATGPSGGPPATPDAVVAPALASLGPVSLARRGFPF